MQLPFVELQRLTVPAVERATAVAYSVPVATPLHYDGFCDNEPPR